MSTNKIDKTKWFHKLHQLQKRVERMESNPGHSSEKEGTRKGQLKRLLERVMGNAKTKKV